MASLETPIYLIINNKYHTVCVIQKTLFDIWGQISPQISLITTAASFTDYEEQVP